MDEPILQLLNHLTLRHFLIGAAASSLILVLLTLTWAVVIRKLTRWARRA